VNERRTVRVERTYDAGPAEVWEMWTTVEGIESWWGPDGFGVEVHELDLRPGGKMIYSMTAVAEEMRVFMEGEGMPVTTTNEISFIEVVPYRRLRYTNVVGFIPGIETYDVGTRLELEPLQTGTRLVLTLDAMHSDEWTDRAVAGWSQELDKLTRALEEKTR
jgi:uncharacterized protein YndB with AHSA1/START domain